VRHLDNWICYVDLSADCATCGASLTLAQQHEGGFCSPLCRLVFLADAHTRCVAALMETPPERDEVSP
jgi:endogenous inhibitor of DNA gyrase (YacG/DUF329 family)